MSKPIVINPIDPKIHFIRGQRVMLDYDLAELYGVPTKVLKQTIKRNRERFPSDFMLELTFQELEILRSQIVTSSWGGRRYLPFAFTEQGISMLSSVLKSKRAIQVNIEIMRAFVRIRQIALTHKELAAKLSALESKVGKHDEDIQAIIAAIQQLIIQEEKPKRKMGFHAEEN